MANLHLMCLLDVLPKNSAIRSVCALVENRLVSAKPGPLPHLANRTVSSDATAAQPVAEPGWPTCRALHQRRASAALRAAAASVACGEHCFWTIQGHAAADG